MRATVIARDLRPRLERAAPFGIDGVRCRVSVRHAGDDSQAQQLLKGASVNLSTRAIAVRVQPESAILKCHARWARAQVPQQCQARRTDAGDSQGNLKAARCHGDDRAD